MKKTSSNLLFFTFSILLFSNSFSQVNPKDSCVFAPMLSLSYAYQLPAGDLKDRFLGNSSLGLDFLIKNRKNYLFGIDGRFLFRDTIKQNTILNPISTSNGFIIDRFGEVAEVFLYERGYTFTFKFGKMFAFNKPNPNSGVVVLLGVGGMIHKIKIFNKDDTAPQITGNYKKGYDRFTTGLMLSEFVGYQYLSNSRLFNFFVGFEFNQGFTKNRRSLDFDTMQKDETKRKDLLNGFRVGWTLPLYKKVAREYYYY